MSSRFLHTLYDGVVSDLMLNMLSSEKLSRAEFDELEVIIAEARKSKSRSRKPGKKS